MTRRTLLSLLTAAAPAPETKLIFGGDVMLCRNPARLARAQHDPALPLRGIAPVLGAADIAFVNLESPFSDKGRIVESGMIFKAEPETIETLKLAGIDVVSTANNHARDRGSYGIEYTLKWLEANGIAAVGTGASPETAHAGTAIVRNGLRFGFLAYAQDQSNGNYPDHDPRICDMDVAAMLLDLAALRTRTDVQVVSMHAGAEYWTRPHPIQIAFGHAAIDAGASVVVGHHPHVTQPVEHYKAGVIFYSLGNLVFDQESPPGVRRGMLGEVTFSGREIATVNTIAVELTGGIPRRKN